MYIAFFCRAGRVFVIVEYLEPVRSYQGDIMKIPLLSFMRATLIGLFFTSSFSNAAVESRTSGTTIEEIVVTAQKREESINEVGMSIQASTGEQLKDLGVTDAFDLYKVVAGFSSNVNYAGTAIYTIRGVGFQENSLATSPTVSVYLDEAPLQFSPMTRGASLDVQRVEALKGPQGTLFGQNATGGAVNFIANKPTSEFEAGVTVSYGEFDAVDIDGFVSGPLNDAWSYRVALRSQTSDDWQESYIGDEEAGSKDEFAYRASLAYENNERTRLLFTLSGFTNESDSLRPQLVGKISQNPINGLVPEFLATPLAPKKAEAADWGPCANNNGGTPTVRIREITITAVTRWNLTINSCPLKFA